MNYDPAAIRKMASVLNSIAGFVLFAYALAALITCVAATVASLSLGGGAAVLGVIGAMVYGLLIFGMGYLIALGIRVVAQLMLAVVQIEKNTAAAFTGASATDTPLAREPLESAQSEDAQLDVSDEMKRLYAAARSAYDEWQYATDNDDTFTYDDDVSTAREAFLVALAALKDGCAQEPEPVRMAAASKCATRYSRMSGDPAFDRLIREMGTRA